MYIHLKAVNNKQKKTIGLNGGNMFKKEGFRATALIVVSIVVIAGVLAVSLFSNRDSGVPGVADEGEIAGIEDIIQGYNPSPAVQPDPQAASVPPAVTDGVAEASPAEVADPALEASVDLKRMVNPVDSKAVSMPYSLNQDPVFSKTLNEYRSDHNGVDLSADVGTPVKAAFEGKVVEVKQDPALGAMVRIDHGNNIYTVYANLDTDIPVSVGDTVKSGSIIGLVGSTAAYEIADGGHLHFSLIVKGDYKDPAAYLGI
jgi:murein DD-endopeptidase MepM/ murein hydrolase activator NlpD